MGKGGYYFGGSAVFCLPYLFLLKIYLPKKQMLCSYLSWFFYYFVSRLSPLPDAVLSQADEWGKFLGLFTLRRRKKLPQTVYRLTFPYSIRLATFTSDIRDEWLYITVYNKMFKGFIFLLSGKRTKNFMKSRSFLNINHYLCI